MTAKSIDLSAVIAGDIIRIHLTPKGAARAPLLLALHQHGYVALTKDEKQRLVRVQETGHWQQGTGRSVCFTATDHYNYHTIVRALGGYILGMPEHIGSEALESPPTVAIDPGLSAASPRARHHAAKPSKAARTAERRTTGVVEEVEQELVNLRVLEEVLAYGFSHSKLGELLFVRSLAISEWLEARAHGAVTAPAQTNANGTKLLALQKIMVALIARDLSSDEAMLWWSKRNLLTHNERPCDTFRLGGIKQVHTAAEKAFPARAAVQSAVGG